MPMPDLAGGAVVVLVEADRREALDVVLVAELLVEPALNPGRPSLAAIVQTPNLRANRRKLDFGVRTF